MAQYNLPKRKLVKNDQQALTQAADVPRSTFINEANILTAFNAGLLIPVFWDEILPGDHMRYAITGAIRLAPPLFPMFSNQTIDFHWWFVPNRLTWTNWKRFMGEQLDPSQSINVEHPYNEITTVGVAGTRNYMGIPAKTYTSPIRINALPLRCYNLIWNEWYRDQDLQNSANINYGDGLDTTTSTGLLPRNKFHDYFTSARPWSQKFASPALPLAGFADVFGIGSESSAYAGAVNVTDTNLAADTYNLSYRSSTEGIVARAGLPGSGLNVYADLATATGISINTFRQAIMLQSLLEKDATGGTRYVELLWKHFHVRNPDYRLQRPEYIGGGSSPLNITAVAQTAPATGTTVGTLGAAGTAAGSHTASYAATEHGIIMCIASVRTELAYQNGIHRKWSRFTRYEYYWPSLAQLGEQAILQRELYADGSATDNTTFGFQERWHEYRTLESRVTGRMASGVTATLDAWHLAQNFTAAQTLGDTFIRDTPPMSRVLAAGTDVATYSQQYIADILIKRTATRPIPMFGTPANLGRL